MNIAWQDEQDLAGTRYKYWLQVLDHYIELLRQQLSQLDRLLDEVAHAEAYLVSRELASFAHRVTVSAERAVAWRGTMARLSEEALQRQGSLRT